MSLPTNVGSGRIVGRYVVGVIDSPDDTDDEPENCAWLGRNYTSAPMPEVPVHGR